MGPILYRLCRAGYHLRHFWEHLYHQKGYTLTRKFSALADCQSEWTDKMDEEYHRLMKFVLRRWLRVRGDLNYCIEDACRGNWERLWASDEEKAYTMQKLTNDLVSEIEYCSDRWTWDRFLRTNWIYQRIKVLETKMILSNTD